MIQTIEKPMLATGYNKAGVRFPCLVQAKIDGCLQGGAKLVTSNGPMTIRDIVDNKIKTEVLTYEEGKGICFKPITNWFNNGSAYECWYTIHARGKKLTCTGNHKIFTERGYVYAERLEPTDKVLFKSLSKFGKSIINGMLFGDSCPTVDKRYQKAGSFRTRFVSNNLLFIKHKIELLGLNTSEIREYESGYGSKCYKAELEALTPYIDFSQFMEWRSKSWKRRKCIPVKELLEMLNDDSLSVWYADDGCIRYNNGKKETPVMTLCTHRYTIQQLREFIKYFVIKYDCCPTIIKDKRVEKNNDGYGASLVFCTEDTFKLLEILRTRVLKGVEYKYYYQDYSYLSGNPIKEEFCKIDDYTTNNVRDTKYDIEVEGTHCYFANNILVHNCRAICLIGTDDRVHILSRGNKEYDVPHLRAWAERHKDLLPLDGEIYNHKELMFQQICSAVKCYSPWTDKLKYVVYDRPVSDETNKNRWAELLTDLEDAKDPVLLCETHIAHSYEEIERWHDYFVQQGYEGAIIRNMDGKYVDGRSGNLMKLKRFDTNEFEVVSVHEAAGQDKGTALFELRVPDTEWTFHARPIGNRELRASYLRDKDKIIGKMCTVRHFGYTDGGKIPRFPVALGIRDYE